jgi:hypothetical protein
MSLTGTNVTSPILPGDTGDRFPSHIDIYGKGGYRSVSGIAQLYNIPENRRSLGMLVYTQDDGRFWALGTGSQNWIELPFTSYTSKINRDGILYNLGDQNISGTKNFHGYNTINFEGVWVDSIGGGRGRFGAGTIMRSGLFSKMSAVDHGFEIIRKIKKFKGAITGIKKFTEEEEERFRKAHKSGRRYPGDDISYKDGDEEITKLIIRSGGRYTQLYRSGLVEGDFEFVPKPEKGEKDIDHNPSPLGSAGFPAGSNGDGGEPGDDEDPNFNDLTEEDEEDENFGFPKDETGYYQPGGGNGRGSSGEEDDGDGPGGSAGPQGGGDGAGLSMFFKSTAPILTLKDHYKSKIRSFRVVEMGGSWPTGLNLIWEPNPNGLWPGEKYTAAFQSIIGSGTTGVVSNNLRNYRTSGLYNILDPLLWRLDFTGKIDGYLTDFNIDPWTGSRDTFIYPVAKRYYGVSSKESLTGDEITGLLSGEYNFDPRQIRTSAKDFVPNTGYLYFAWPARTGFNNVDFFKDYQDSQDKGIIHAPKFIERGYRFIIDKRDVHFNESIVSVKNSVNYTEDYYVYRNRWLLHGSDPIKVHVIGVLEDIDKIYQSKNK